jgi:uroporphyrinogen-III synthase
MPEWQHPTGKKVLIMRGVGGRDLLCQTLREQGAHVDMIELYHRELPHEAASQWQQTPRPDIVILTSPAALNHWKIIAGTHAIQPLWLVVSSRLHAQAQQEGARVCLAHSADTQSLLAALQSFYQG